MNDFRKSKLDERYLNDASFHMLVKTLESMISQHGFTPSELREAIFFAHYKYEMENPSAMDNRIRARMLSTMGLLDEDAVRRLKGELK